jgi:multiple sugar transport system permease protein
LDKFRSVTDEQRIPNGKLKEKMMVEMVKKEAKSIHLVKNKSLAARLGITLAKGESVTKEDFIFALILFLPAFLVLLFLGTYPIFNAVLLSFQRKGIFDNSVSWIGLENFQNILFSGKFWVALKNTIVFTLGSVIIQTIFGLAIALLLNNDFPGRNVFRGFVLVNYVVPIAVAALIWRFILSDTVGILFHSIKALNLPFPNTWFASPKTSMASVIMINVWKYFPFMVIMFLARLQTIDIELYDAVKVDGANRWQAFRYITLPMIMPVIVIVLLLRTIWTFNNWELIALTTGGGPLDSTVTLPILAYNVMFDQFSQGRAAAYAVLMMVILLVSIVAYFKAYNWAEESLS